jgi:hypothetical protein
LEEKLEETKAAKKALKFEDKSSGNGLVGGRLVGRFDEQEKSKVGWPFELSALSLSFP